MRDNLGGGKVGQDATIEVWEECLTRAVLASSYAQHLDAIIDKYKTIERVFADPLKTADAKRLMETALKEFGRRLSAARPAAPSAPAQAPAPPPVSDVI
jgi:hypothetical protein